MRKCRKTFLIKHQASLHSYLRIKHFKVAWLDNKFKTNKISKYLYMIKKMI